MFNRIMKKLEERKAERLEIDNETADKIISSLLDRMDVEDEIFTCVVDSHKRFYNKNLARYEVNIPVELLHNIARNILYGEKSDKIINKSLLLSSFNEELIESSLKRLGCNISYVIYSNDKNYLTLIFDISELIQKYEEN